MSKEVERAFEEFERDRVRVPKSVYKKAQKVHPEVRKAAEKAFPGETSSWLSGSYGRKTQAGPTFKDIDLIVEFTDVEGTILVAPASIFLDRVREAVKECDLVRHTRLGVRAVKCFLNEHEFTVDIVPGVRSPNGQRLYLARHLQNEGLDDWQLLHPRGQLEAAREKNSATDGIYVPVVRMIRFWNQGFAKGSKPLRSYHAEALVYHSLPSSTGYEDAVVAFFDHAYDALAPGRLTSDPGDPNQFVDERLDADERRAAREKVGKAREDAHAAAAIEDPDEACEAWTKVFGSAFPASSTGRDALAKGLKKGTAGASGSGLKRNGERPLIRSRSWKRS